MLEILYYVFSSFWIWAGITLTGLVWLGVIFGSIGEGMKGRKSK